MAGQAEAYVLSMPSPAAQGLTPTLPMLPQDPDPRCCFSLRSELTLTGQPGACPQEGRGVSLEFHLIGGVEVQTELLQEQ